MHFIFYGSQKVHILRLYNYLYMLLSYFPLIIYHFSYQPIE